MERIVDKCYPSITNSLLECTGGEDCTSNVSVTGLYLYLLHLEAIWPRMSQINIHNRKTETEHSSCDSLRRERRDVEVSR